MKDIKIFLKKKKNRKRQYCCERYKNISEDKKQKLIEYRKKHYRMKKNTLLLKRNDLESSFEKKTFVSKNFQSIFKNT